MADDAVVEELKRALHNSQFEADALRAAMVAQPEQRRQIVIATIAGVVASGVITWWFAKGRKRR